MIGKLSGIIDSIDTAHLILDVNGVGYVVNASRRTLAQIGQAGDTLSLSIETAVREDAITLYGFQNAAEQAWFKLLTSVQGVGAKAGLSILSVQSPEQLQIAIAAQDKPAITQADGVGPKLATRILTELKDKAGSLAVLPISAGAPEPSAAKSNNQSEGVVSGVNNDAVSALINLGYGRSESYSAVMKAQSAGNDNLQDLIREALKELSA